MKIGILINKNFQNFEKIKKIIYKIITNKNLKNIEIIIFDRENFVDKKLIKILDLFNINYKKFKPYFLNYDLFCIENKYFFYKKYNLKYLFIPYIKFLNYISNIIIFDCSDYSMKDTIIEYFKTKYKNKNNIGVITYDN